MVFPDDAWMGATLHRCAQAALERIRLGLSPVATNNTASPSAHDLIIELDNPSGQVPQGDHGHIADRVPGTATGTEGRQFGDQSLLIAAQEADSDRLGSCEHVSSILTKLGLSNRAQVVAFAYESGLVKPGDGDVGF